MKKYLKKYGFVALLALLFGCISIYYIFDSNKDVVKGKKVNGEDVVFSIDDQNVSVSEYYDALYDNSGSNAVRMLFERYLISQAYETTPEMEEEAKAQAQEIITSFQYQYGNSYKEELSAILQSMGYKGDEELETYVIDAIKQEQLLNEYGDAHFDELQIRDVSYILIQHENASAPTAEATEDELARMAAVDEALASGQSFAEAATNFSEDQSSAPTGGDLGVLDNMTDTLDSVFLETSLKLKEGEISDWVHSDQFGYFKIKNNASTIESLNEWLAAKAEEGEMTNIYYQLANSYDYGIYGRAISEKANQIGFDFHGNTELEESFKETYGLGAN